MDNHHTGAGLRADTERTSKLASTSTVLVRLADAHAGDAAPEHIAVDGVAMR